MLSAFVLYCSPDNALSGSRSIVTIWYQATHTTIYVIKSHTDYRYYQLCVFIKTTNQLLWAARRQHPLMEDRDGQEIVQSPHVRLQISDRRVLFIFGQLLLFPVNDDLLLCWETHTSQHIRSLKGSLAQSSQYVRRQVTRSQPLPEYSGPSLHGRPN